MINNSDHNSDNRVAEKTFEERQARERSDQVAQRRNLFQLADNIRHNLGPDWERSPARPGYDFEETHPHIRRKADGAEFWLGIETYGAGKGRIGVHANWPKDARGTEQRPRFSSYSEFGTDCPGITFAATKTSQQAARDIERRFLSAFLPLWEKRAQQIADQTAHENMRADLANKIAALLLGQAKHENGNSSVWLGYRERGITAVEFSGDSIQLKITCNWQELHQLTQLFPPKKGQGQK